MIRTLLIAALLVAPFAYADSYVPGYIKSDGTYVQGHFKSSPNNSKLDNYSTQGNVNPYTGKKGTVDPYALPKNEYASPYSQPSKGRKQFDTYSPYEFKAPKY